MTTHYQPGQHQHWEDAYQGVLHASFDDLWAMADEFWRSGLAAYNLPVWIDYDGINDREYDCGPTVQVGVMLPRHGYTVVHMAPATPDEVRQLQGLLARIWALRADVGFPRYGLAQQADRPE